MAEEKKGVFERMLKAVGLRKDSRDDVIPPGWIMRDVGTGGPHGTQEIPPSAPDFLEEYRRSLWVYDCVSAKARAAGGVPWVLKREEDGDDPVISDHPAIKLLKNPAAHMTWSDLVEGIVTHLELVGNAYLEKVGGGKRPDGKEIEGPISSLLRLYPDKVKVIVKPKEGVVSYEHRANFAAKPTLFTPEEVVHFQYLDPSKEFVGCGAMGPSFMSSRMDTASTRWNAAFFNNGAHHDIILSTDKPMAPAERNRIKNEYTESGKGPSRGRGVYFAPSGITVSPFGESHREMQFERLKRMTREEIHAAFHVPPVLSGLLDGSSFATASVQLMVFRDQVLIPLMRSIFAVIKRSILADFEDGENLYLDVDTSEMKMPEERDRDFNRALTWYQAGLLDENEARSMANLKPLTPKQLEERRKKLQEQQMAAMGGGFGGPPKEEGGGEAPPKPGQQTAKPDTKDKQPKLQETEKPEPDEDEKNPTDKAKPTFPKKKKPEEKEEKKGEGKNGAGKNGKVKVKKDEEGVESLRKRMPGLPWDDILPPVEEEEEHGPGAFGE